MCRSVDGKGVPGDSGWIKLASEMAQARMPVRALQGVPTPQAA
jgi:hypothetical protein